jgi:hypothetical protein
MKGVTRGEELVLDSIGGDGWPGRFCGLDRIFKISAGLPKESPNARRRPKHFSVPSFCRDWSKRWMARCGLTLGELARRVELKPLMKISFIKVSVTVEPSKSPNDNCAYLAQFLMGIFKSIIARGNVFRRPVGSAPNSSEIGFSFKNCTSVIVENNVADVGTSVNNAVSYSVCETVKAFNNKKPDGTFVAAYDTSTSVHLGELTTDVEDALLTI